MPEARLARTRPTLPTGYQFGMARDRDTGISIRFIRMFDAEQCRKDSLLFSSEELRRWNRCMERLRGWNVIEGEHDHAE